MHIRNSRVSILSLFGRVVCAGYVQLVVGELTGDWTGSLKAPAKPVRTDLWVGSL